MCLAIPAKIESIENDVATCRVGEGETRIQVSLMLTESDPQVGDYVIVHAGFALRVLDPEEAEESLRILRDMARAMEGQEHLADKF
ncbi:HypC/HybG/HupF family hydrogenase formation chaperone [Desulfohalovibrio reitneri]|jgi:hydrogenase expression/formation protein HypC|uniref:HypC/HybG/HupF family hydrogenase formation chaperone n=1 Tax=Desulfohalovibrio reitneri TaxID=1307759 RepID=UPI0004A6CAF9|nr:HypC/HybG/HupF family hydrogenase formation chaperone [Desulfohalovibrio reitneri]